MADEELGSACDGHAEGVDALLAVSGMVVQLPEARVELIVIQLRPLKEVWVVVFAKAAAAVGVKILGLVPESAPPEVAPVSTVTKLAA